MAVTVGRSALAVVDLILAQGADNSFEFRYSETVDEVVTPVDLSGWSARGQIRRSPGGELWVELQPTLDSEGVVSFSIGHAVTEDAAWDRRSSGVWDLELIDPDGKVTRFVEGTVTVSHDVTRNDD